MLAPKRILHRKVQRGSMKGQAKGNTELHFGEYGIVALDRHWITNRQIEAARIAMTRYMKRGGKVYITIFPDKPITKKPAETRMGSGKVTPRSGWPSSSRAALCSRSPACPRRSLARPCVLPSTSCRSRPRSLPALRTGEDK